MQTSLKLDIWSQSYDEFVMPKTIPNQRIWTLFLPIYLKNNISDIRLVPLDNVTNTDDVRAPHTTHAEIEISFSKQQLKQQQTKRSH